MQINFLNIKTMNEIKQLSIIIFSLIILSCKGPQGDPGPIGPAGPQGTAGVNGTNGKDGEKGAQGIPGATNENIITTNWVQFKDTDYRFISNNVREIYPAFSFPKSNNDAIAIFVQTVEGAASVSFYPYSLPNNVKTLNLRTKNYKNLEITYFIGGSSSTYNIYLRLRSEDGLYNIDATEILQYLRFKLVRFN